MRKAQKQEVLEMIQTLHQAHDEVKNYIARKNYVLAQDILSQCQECAISIGTVIEKVEGEGFATVSYVENYCDVLFSIYDELNGDDINANKAYKNLKKQLLRIENSVKNDVPVRKEIAFFPYKASMWDALESVYLAAKKEPNCDAYCVPIPYYDRNPDRSLGEMHYEGREYPKNIEVIDWQTYNFEERRPDVVYIHNPYDDWNLVTCVHPRYFSANLKKYTEELVYIPYFVLDEIEPSDQTKIDGMKHFCFLPGVVNADKVIVQSEKMKQIYINEYLKAAQAHGLGGYHLDRKKLEEKFLGLGSPKFDKVKNTKKEDLEIPEEWLKIIEKPDGSWKKIIFYNTSIAALLENNEKMLEKMKYVFSVFKENQDKVALLWRPHPLIKSTVSSMRPQLWVEYEKLVNQYRQEGWGIYDDSSDMDRAVVLSDAYYGDPSSVVQVYQQTGKPVMIQNLKIDNIRTSDVIVANNMCIVGNKLWFVHSYFNDLLCIDLNEGKIKYETTLEGIEDTILMIGDIVPVNNRLVMLPLASNQIVIYDLNTKNKKYIKCEEKNEKKRRFKKYVENQEKIFLLPLENREIIIFDKKTEKIKKDENWYKKFLEFAEDNEKYLFTESLIEEENGFLVLLKKNNILLKFNFETQVSELFRIDNMNETLISMCKRENTIWFLTEKGNLYLADDGIFELKFMKHLTMETGEYVAYYISDTDNIVFFPTNGDTIYVYDIRKDLEQNINLGKNKTVRLCKKINNYIVFQRLWSEGIWVLNLCNMEIDRINAVAEQQWLSILFKKKYITEDINGQVNLKSMIDFLQYE